MWQKDKDSNTGNSAQQRPSSTTLQRLLQPRWQQIEGTRSPGEALLPFFLALVEACWFNAILLGLAGLDFLHSGTTLLPFWGVPLLFCVTLWLFQRELQQEASAEDSATEQDRQKKASFGLLFAVLALLDAGLIWLHIYARANFLLDPRWLLAFVDDLLLLDNNFYQALAIVIITVYLCWRGTKLGQLTIEPGHVRRQLWVGLLVLAIAILLRAGQNKASSSSDDLVLVLLMPTFLYLALSSHALARTSFMRHVHPSGLEGNIATQERAMLSIIGGMGLVLLLLTLLGSFFFSATFFAALQPVWREFVIIYSWLVSNLTLLLAWILSPLFWLLEQLSSRLSSHSQTPVLTHINLKKGHTQAPVSSNAPAIALAVEIFLPFLILLVISVLLWRALRRRKRLRMTRNQASGDVHENVWSWRLFWQQLKTFLAALFGRRGARDGRAATAQSLAELPTEPAARSIRVIYRALLRKASRLGYARKRAETPYEFQLRLNQQHITNSEPQLGQITEAYALTRYGGSVPGDLDLARARQAWEELEKKWQTDR
ncbi:MAG TPA: DUF4129 domain-containing protein [Ktedonobacteraceae bacterium]